MGPDDSLGSPRRKRARVHPLEIVVACVILGLACPGLIWTNPMGPLKDAKIKTATLDVRNIANAVDMYQVRHRRLPTSLDELIPTDIKEIHKDPWHQPYAYRVDEGGYGIVSFGPDKTEGGGDDISSGAIGPQ